MTLEDLAQAVYEDLNGCITLVEKAAQDYRVMFQCDDWQESERVRQFSLIFSGVGEAIVFPSLCDQIAVHSEHPLLWNHNDEQAQMYFSSAPERPEELLGTLYEAHNRLMSGWREMSQYVYANSERLRAGHGLFAKGPIRLMREYSAVIGSVMNHTIVEAYSPSTRGYRVVLFEYGHIIYKSGAVNEEPAP
jgi:hypothetical protein